MEFLFTALQRFRLLSLTVAWVAGVVSILLADPSGPAAVAGAYAFGLFILLTMARLSALCRGRKIFWQAVSVS